MTKTFNQGDGYVFAANEVEATVDGWFRRELDTLCTVRPEPSEAYRCAPGYRLLSTHGRWKVTEIDEAIRLLPEISHTQLKIQLVTMSRLLMNAPSREERLGNLRFLEAIIKEMRLREDIVESPG